MRRHCQGVIGTFFDFLRGIAYDVPVQHEDLRPISSYLRRDALRRLPWERQLRVWRALHGLSQGEVAEILGVGDHSHVSRIERGLRPGVRTDAEILPAYLELAGVERQVAAQEDRP